MANEECFDDAWDLKLVIADDQRAKKVGKIDFRLKD